MGRWEGGRGKGGKEGERKGEGDGGRGGGSTGEKPEVHKCGRQRRARGGHHGAGEANLDQPASVFPLLGLELIREALLVLLQGVNVRAQPGQLLFRGPAVVLLLLPLVDEGVQDVANGSSLVATEVSEADGVHDTEPGEGLVQVFHALLHRYGRNGGGGCIPHALFLCFKLCSRPLGEMQRCGVREWRHKTRAPAATQTCPPPSSGGGRGSKHAPVEVCVGERLKQRGGGQSCAGPDGSRALVRRQETIQQNREHRPHDKQPPSALWMARGGSF